METIFPARLRKGDKIGIVSPSNTLEGRMDKFHKAVENFRRIFEVEIVVAPHALGRHFYSSGTTRERLDDIHSMFSDPSIKAIVCSVGGDTAVDLVDKLDYGLIKSNPKIFTGISDATTLLNPIFAKTGLVTFLGIEFTEFGEFEMAYESEQIKKFLFEGEAGEIPANPNWKDFYSTPTRYQGRRIIRKGTAQGKLLGGNFDSFIQILFTPYTPDFQGSILAVETYRYTKKEIHKAFAQLRLQGVLEKISGLVIGYCIGSDDEGIPGNERDIGDLLLEVTQKYSFPIVEIGEIGHYVENAIIPIGAEASLEADSRVKLSIVDPVVV